MDSFEFNKIAGAVLATVFLVFGGSLLAGAIYHSETPEKAGYTIVAAEAPAAGEGAAAVAEDPPVATLLASANPDKGAAEFKKCQACHSGDEGGPNKVGPHLWDVVNRPVASVGDFSYSAGMKDFSQGSSVHWDFDHLYHFIKAPKQYVPGTAMGFAGLKDPQGRADLIAYLRTLSKNPAALPDPAAAAPAEAAAAPAADGAAPTADAAAPAPTAEAPAATPQAGAAAPVPAAAPATSTPDAAAPAAPAATPEPAAPAAAAPAVVAPAPAAAPAAPAPAAPAAAPAPAAPAPAAPAATPAAPAPTAPAAPAAPAPAAPAAPAAAPAQQGAAAAPAAATQTASAGDAKAGANVFKKCQACHAVGAGAANKVGPELNGIIGEKVADVEGYNFSPALKAFAGTNPAWTPELLTQWLTDPKKLVPGTKMAFPGLKKPEDIANVLAYLGSFDETGAPK